MKVLCAACGASLDKGTPESADGGEVSHGLCPDCSQRLLAQVGIPLQEYLEGIPIPTVVWTEDGLIRGANRAARGLLGNPLAEAMGRFAGEVFECGCATLPEGCGRTVHCSGCAIRKTVMTTAKTGKRLRRVPASLRPAPDGEPQRTDMLIWTEKKGGVVFVRIDLIEPSAREALALLE